MACKNPECRENFVQCQKCANERICRLYKLLRDSGIEGLQEEPPKSSAMKICISSMHDISASITGLHTHGHDWDLAEWGLKSADYYEILCYGLSNDEENAISEKLENRDGYINGHLRVDTDKIVNFILTMQKRYT
jgi:hypothetical protein